MIVMSWEAWIEMCTQLNQPAHVIREEKLTDEESVAEQHGG